jgi:hypothetical protein
VAIIVPYRDREDHLRTFLLNIHRFLQRQQNEYGIYIVEQVFITQPPSKQVNMIMNLSRVSDPHWFNVDPDTDPDPAVFLIADPDSWSGSRVLMTKFWKNYSWNKIYIF